MASKTCRRIILWLRNDLRVHDHEPLLAAIKDAGGEVVPVYFFDPRQYRMTKYGFRKTGPLRAKFTIECVADLRESLRKLGSGLVVRCDRPEDAIPKLAELYDAKAVYCHSEVTSEELAVEKALSAAMPLKKYWGATTLYHLDDLPEEVDPRRRRLPAVFSHFRKRVEADLPSRKILPAPDAGELAPLPPGLEEGNLPTIEDLCGEGADAKTEPRAVLPFRGGESAGRERVKYYLWDSDRLAAYKDTRDGLVGGDYSSKFAPWLAQGCITSQWIHAEIMRYESERTANKSTYWLVFELLWRDYFRFVAIQSGNDMFKPGGLQHKSVQWRYDKGLFEAWRTGGTGFPFVDANMKELMLTGFMSNRGRQNVASFLTKDLLLDWRPGAAWFESCLLDYDVCSNYGNWNYAAGIGNDPREDRHFNIPKQAKTYDPSGEFVKLWLPALAGLPATQVHEPYLLKDNPYIPPIIQHLGRSKMPLDARGKVFAGSSSQRYRGPPHINDKVRDNGGASKQQPPAPRAALNSGGRVQGGYRTVTGGGSAYRGKSLPKDSRRDKMAGPDYDEQFPAL